MKIQIHNSTYIFLLISFLAGYFEYVFLFLLIILIHEFGHAFFSKIINFKLDKIMLYPFGGLTIYKEDLNISTNKELFVLMGGIIFQSTFYFLITILYKNSLVTDNTYFIFNKINVLLVSFNFLPILPLDGGKLINILLDKVFSYQISNLICIYISFIFIMLFLLFNKTYYSILLTIFLVKNIIVEINILGYKYNKFLLERYMNKYNFKKIRFVNNIYKFKRDNYHIINNSFERDYLSKLFDTSI